MKKRLAAAALTLACGAGFLAGQGFAQDEGSGGMQLPDWMQMGEEQAGFKTFVGDWDVAQKVSMGPGQPPMETSGASATGRLLWDGRFLEVDFQGDMMGTPYEGRWLVGFDRVDREYVHIWIDSLSTYMSISRGTEKDGETTFKLNDPDFMTNKKVETDMVLKRLSDDSFTMSFIEMSAEGEPNTTLVMTYTRKK